MNIKRVCVLYFSPTGGTEKIAHLVAENLSEKLNIECTFFDITQPKNRYNEYHFSEDDLVVMASPVYAGRLPNKLVPEYKAKIWGEGTPAVPICVFGNRSPDESLRELMILMEDNGFSIVGAAAFAGRHAFSDQIGAKRPDENDLDEIAAFTSKVVQKLTDNRKMFLKIDHSELGAYYTPLKEDGTPAKFLKARPYTDADRCIHCGLCVEKCPLESIDINTMETVGLCIKCQACVRCCPTHAKYFDDTDFLSHVAMLEKNYKRRAKNIMII
ncbi:EFR1 family ferrodoxin [Massilicoli timonensis]|uniref:EFR1 family ferrodoxin n=1 Tax=Massilicoli timonensis TaxID=2015901 RepID=UPI000C85416A|nr:EFR1 family ferrodoxin [Massilicoli timonensis]